LSFINVMETRENISQRVATLCFFLCVAMPLGLTACGKPPLYQQQAYVFGTLVEVSVYGAPEEQARLAAQAVLTRFDQLHRKLHAWQTSDLSQINAAFAQGKKAAIDPELAAMLADATAISVQSGHLFNPAIGKLIALWGFQSDLPQSRIPQAADIARLVKARPRMTAIHIRNGMAWSDNPSVQLDLGGYAKGYALDEAVRILKRHGIQHALVNIGGNIIALGQHGDRPWRVGIQHPRHPGTLATLDLNDGEAIGTSGDYQRYFESSGQRYCHLLDPRTGYPASGMQSVTVLASGLNAGARSDAVSKPLFIDGRNNLRENAGRMGVTHYLAVDSTGGKIVSATLALRLRH
jgi:thiamine biosynthesis lipoprotein